MTPEAGSENGGGSHLREVEALSRQRGRLLFDGRWLMPGEVPSHHRRLRSRSFWVVVETLAVLALLLFVAFFLYLLVRAYVA